MTLKDYAWTLKTTRQECIEAAYEAHPELRTTVAAVCRLGKKMIQHADERILQLFLEASKR